MSEASRPKSCDLQATWTALKAEDKGLFIRVRVLRRPPLLSVGTEGWLEGRRAATESVAWIKVGSRTESIAPIHPA
jgi:hypothetical protein